MRTSMKVVIAAILVIGVIRFALTIVGLPNSVVKYASMSVIIAGGAIYFAIASSTHKGRLKDAYLLILPYMIVEVAALGFTWATGRETIFHAAEYSFGSGIALHTAGHFIGGLTWEPLFLFLVMEIVWGIYALGRRLFLGPSLTSA
jgi:hypothetical protein